MAHRDYSHRDVLDKLGIKPAQAVAVDDTPGLFDTGLHDRLAARLGRTLAATDEPVDVALVTFAEGDDAVAVLTHWRTRLHPAGGVWLVTPKRGWPGYVDQRELICAGPAAGVVDNKVCSVSDHLSALRFVIRRVDRP